MVSLYEITIPVFIKNLQILSKLLKKGVEFTKQDGVAVTEQSLLESKLIADMKDLVYQIQRVSDTSKGFAVRVGKLEPVPIEDNEKTFEDLQARIAKTIEVLESVKKEVIDSAENEEVTLKTGGGEVKFTATTYANTFAIPNFYFHFVVAYALLRKEGVQIGKSDYLGRN